MPASTQSQFISLYALVLCALVAPSQSMADLVKLDTDVGFESAFLLEDSEDSVTMIALTVLAGEIDVEGPEGLAHYLEHLMFLHADTAAENQIHARGGNAWVNGYITSYYNESENSDLADMLEFVKRLFEPPMLDKDIILRERSVVAREYDFRVSENPDRRIWTQLRRDLYNNLAVSRSTIGTLDSIQSLTFVQATKFHQRFYHPSNSVLFISGNLKKNEAESIVESHFGDIEPGARHAAQWRDARITESSDTVQKFSDSQVNHERLMYLSLSAWPENQNTVENWYALKLLQSVLDSALEGGIARPLRMDNFILKTFSIGLNSYLSNYFELAIEAEPDKGVSLAQASTAITDTLGSLARVGITQATLDRVRSRMLQTEHRESNSMKSNYSRMSQQLSSGFSPVTFHEHVEYIEKVSLKDVNKVLRALANPKRRSVAHIIPEGN